MSLPTAAAFQRPCPRARGGFPIGHLCGGEPCWSDAKIAVHASSAPCVIVDMELWYP